MRFLVVCILYIITACVQNCKAQCPPTYSNIAITGLYTLDINPPFGTTIYVTPTATVTGNIYLNKASLYNCGLILSPKIVIKKSASLSQLTFENNGTIKTDSIVMDSLSHFHNNDTLFCKYFEIKHEAQASNMWIMDLGSLIIQDQSFFDTDGDISTDNLELKGPSSNFYNQYGRIMVKKLFKNAATCSFHGIIFMCVDSCFINNGMVSNSAMNTWQPFINVAGISENTGTINSPNFCDMTSINGGMLDVNTGTVNITGYCTGQQYNCNYMYASIKESDKELQFSIYPNPANLILNVSDEQNRLQSSIIEIKNYLGQIVVSATFSKQINTSNLSSGMYFLTVRDKSRKKTVKFIKE